MQSIRASTSTSLLIGRSPNFLISRPLLDSSCRPILATRLSIASARPCKSLEVFAKATSAEPSASAATSAVRVIIQGRRLQVTDAIKAYVSDKINRACAHYAKVLKEVDVSLSARGGDTGTHGKKLQTVEVTIYTLGNGVVRVEDSEESLYAAIDLVCDKIERKLNKVKQLGIGKGKWPGRAGPREPQLEEAEFNDFKQSVLYEIKISEDQQALSEQFAQLNQTFPTQVRRTKKVELDLMTVDEAIDSMEAVGHDFFVFREMETDAIQVVYRRQAEGYGVLVPIKRE